MISAEELRSGLGEEVGYFAARPLVAVRLDDGPDLRPEAGRLPCVVVGIAPEGFLPDKPPDLDVLLTGSADAASPWVTCTETGAALAQLAERCRSSPLAAVALVQLLRLTAGAAVSDSLVGESFVYSMLQGGPEHRGWLGRRTPRPAVHEGGEPVVATRDGGTLTIRLDRPRYHNAYNAAMRDGLVAALEVAASDPSVRSVELSGNGPSFCSGGDLAEFGTAPDPATAHAVRVERGAARWMHRCADRTTVRVHGACIGAGVELASFSHRVVAHPDTVFQLPEVAMGLIPGAGGTVGLPGRIGRQRTAHLALTGTALDARTALGLGPGRRDRRRRGAAAPAGDRRFGVTSGPRQVLCGQAQADVARWDRTPVSRPQRTVMDVGADPRTGQDRARGPYPDWTPEPVIGDRIGELQGVRSERTPEHHVS